MLFFFIWVILYLKILPLRHIIENAHIHFFNWLIYLGSVWFRNNELFVATKMIKQWMNWFLESSSQDKCKNRTGNYLSLRTCRILTRLAHPWLQFLTLKPFDLNNSKHTQYLNEYTCGFVYMQHIFIWQTIMLYILNLHLI